MDAGRWFSNDGSIGFCWAAVSPDRGGRGTACGAEVDEADIAGRGWCVDALEVGDRAGSAWSRVKVRVGRAQATRGRVSSVAGVGAGPIWVGGANSVVCVVVEARESRRSGLQ